MRNDLAVSVIIPSVGRVDSVRDLLSSIQRQRFNRPFEVFVVANLPDDKLKSTVLDFGPAFQYLESGRRGANIARNKGLSHARGEILLFLDDDCGLNDPDFIEKHWIRHQMRPNAAGCGGRYVLAPGSSPVERAYHWIADHWLTKSILDDNRTLNLIGGNCSFKASVLGADLRFNEAIRFGGAETDFCARLLKRGLELFLFDDMNVEHRPSISARAFMEKAWLQGYSAGVRDTEFTKPQIKHWRSTLSIEDNWTLAGVRPEPELKKYFTLYDHLFEFGFDRGRRAGTRSNTRPPLKIGEFCLYRARRWSAQPIRSWIYNCFLSLDRCMAATRSTDSTESSR